MLPVTVKYNILCSTGMRAEFERMPNDWHIFFFYVDYVFVPDIVQ